VPNPVAIDHAHAVRRIVPLQGKRPCAVIPVLRRRYCRNPEAHYAEVQITYYYCGHRVSYCQSALEFMLQGFKDRTPRKGGAVCPVCRQRAFSYAKTALPRT
jgi:hypothetical protein